MSEPTVQLQISPSTGAVAQYGTWKLGGVHPVTIRNMDGDWSADATFAITIKKAGNYTGDPWVTLGSADIAIDADDARLLTCDVDLHQAAIYTALGDSAQIFALFQLEDTSTRHRYSCPVRITICNSTFRDGDLPPLPPDFPDNFEAGTAPEWNGEAWVPVVYAKPADVAQAVSDHTATGVHETAQPPTVHDNTAHSENFVYPDEEGRISARLFPQQIAIDDDSTTPDLGELAVIVDQVPDPTAIYHLTKGDGVTARGFPVGFSADNAVLVQSHGTDLQRGAALLAAKAKAATLTPGGSPLGPDNRAWVFAYPGNYALSADLVWDTGCVNLITIGSGGGGVMNLGSGNHLALRGGDFHLVADWCWIKGVACNPPFLSGSRFVLAGEMDNVVVQDCFSLQSQAFAFLSGTGDYTGGVFINVVCGELAFGPALPFRGRIIDSVNEDATRWSSILLEGPDEIVITDAGDARADGKYRRVWPTPVMWRWRFDREDGNRVYGYTTAMDKVIVYDLEAEEAEQWDDVVVYADDGVGIPSPTVNVAWAEGVLPYPTMKWPKAGQIINCRDYLGNTINRDAE